MKRCPVPHPNRRGKTAHNQAKYIPDVKFRDLATRTLRPCPMPGLVMRLIHCCTVKAILISRLGGPEVLQVADVPELFFQAEDGIRDLTVTGVQTCALPI